MQAGTITIFIRKVKGLSTEETWLVVIVSPTRVAWLALVPSSLRTHMHEHCGDAFVAAVVATSDGT